MHPFPFVLLLLGIYGLILCHAMRPYIEILKDERKRGGGRLQFTITDCWAAAIGLTPTSWLTAATIMNSRHAELSETILNVAFVGLFVGSSQLCGIAMAVATNVAPSRKIRSNSSSAFYVLIGALMGLVMPSLALMALLSNLWQWRGKKRLTRTTSRRCGNSLKFPKNRIPIQPTRRGKKITAAGCPVYRAAPCPAALQGCR